MTSVKQKTCSNCGKDFGCGAEAEKGSCWCADLPHLPTTSITDRDCLCPVCLSAAIEVTLQVGGDQEQPAQKLRRTAQQVISAKETEVTSPELLVEGEDYYLEAGMIVFTASYHRRRGYCCDSGCRHCPYKG